MTSIKKKIVDVVNAVVLIFVLGILISSCYSVDTGEVAVVSRFGKINRVQTAGLNFKLPFIETKQFMEVRERTYVFGKTDEMDTTLEVSTKDMQSIKIDLTVQVNIAEPEKLYRAFQMKYDTRLVRPRVKEVVQSTIAKYTIEEFVSKREEISTIINNGVSEALGEYGMIVGNVSIVNHDFSMEYEKAIEQKKVAEQAVERARAEQAKLLVEQENRVKVAEFKLKEKELQAKANAVEAQSLSPILIRKMTIEKWDGHLPKVQGNTSSLIQLD